MCGLKEPVPMAGASPEIWWRGGPWRGKKLVERAACGQSAEDRGGRDAEFGPVLAALWRRGQTGSGTPVRKSLSPERRRDEET